LPDQHVNVHLGHQPVRDLGRPAFVTLTVAPDNLNRQIGVRADIEAAVLLIHDCKRPVRGLADTYRKARLRPGKRTYVSDSDAGPLRRGVSVTCRNKTHHNRQNQRYGKQSHNFPSSHL
jgi:hypothetical protein